MVIPTEYDSHWPRLESQSRKAWAPPTESVRISACCPRSFDVVGGLAASSEGARPLRRKDRVRSSARSERE